MTAIGIIPARYASVRFPGKVLAAIGGKPMIQHVWEKAQAAQELDDVLIACDHPDVFRAGMQFGAKVVMTNPAHPSGTDRIAEAAQELEFDIIVNIQGDEPFIDPKTINDLTLLLKNDAACPMGTVIKAIADEQEFNNPNVVKCVVDQQGYALYFSRSPIPYNRNGGPYPMQRYKHLGLYAYRKEFLMAYKTWSKSTLESTEQLEQLRVLDKGHRIKTALTAYESIAVDVPDDLRKAEAWLKQLK